MCVDLGVLNDLVKNEKIEIPKIQDITMLVNDVSILL